MKDLPKPLTDSRSFIISHSIFAGYMLVARMYANRFKIRNNRPAQQSIAYLFKITQCLEVFSTLLPAVALEQYSSEKAKTALRAISEKF